MSDPNNNTYGLQVSTTVAGDLYNIRGANPDEFEANLQGLAEKANTIHESLTTFKQAGIATGVFTGTTTGTPAPPAAEPARSAGSPPPTSGPPECEGGHGPMKDFGDAANRKRNKKGDPYRNRYYCSNFGSDCKPRD